MVGRHVASSLHADYARSAREFHLVSADAQTLTPDFDKCVDFTHGAVEQSDAPPHLFAGGVLDLPGTQNTNARRRAPSVCVILE
jgi:hypothetical protein